MLRYDDLPFLLGLPKADLAEVADEVAMKPGQTLPGPSPNPSPNLQTHPEPWPLPEPKPKPEAGPRPRPGAQPEGRPDVSHAGHKRKFIDYASRSPAARAYIAAPTQTALAAPAVPPARASILRALA